MRSEEKKKVDSLYSNNSKPEKSDGPGSISFSDASAKPFEASKSSEVLFMPDLSLPDEVNITSAGKYFLQELNKIRQYNEEFNSKEPHLLLGRQRSDFRKLCQSAIMKRLQEITMDSGIELSLRLIAIGVVKETDAKMGEFDGYLEDKFQDLQTSKNFAKHKQVLERAVASLFRLLDRPINQATQKELVNIRGECFGWGLPDEGIAAKKAQMSSQPELKDLLGRFECEERQLVTAIQKWQLEQGLGGYIEERSPLLPSQLTHGKLVVDDETSGASQSPVRQSVKLVDLSKMSPVNSFHSEQAVSSSRVTVRLNTQPINLSEEPPVKE